MKKNKMIAKGCPKCDQQVPVACKACPCGHSFFNARRTTRVPSPGEDIRRRTQRVRREKPNYYDALEYDKQLKKTKTRSSECDNEDDSKRDASSSTRTKKRKLKKEDEEEDDIINHLSPEKQLPLADMHYFDEYYPLHDEEFNRRFRILENNLPSVTEVFPHFHPQPPRQLRQHYRRRSYEPRREYNDRRTYYRYHQHQHERYNQDYQRYNQDYQHNNQYYRQDQDYRQDNQRYGQDDRQNQDSQRYSQDHHHHYHNPGYSRYNQHHRQ